MLDCLSLRALLQPLPASCPPAHASRPISLPSPRTLHPSLNLPIHMSYHLLCLCICSHVCLPACLPACLPRRNRLLQERYNEETSLAAAVQRLREKDQLDSMTSELFGAKKRIALLEAELRIARAGAAASAAVAVRSAPETSSRRKKSLRKIARGPTASASASTSASASGEGTASQSDVTLAFAHAS